MGGSYFSVRKGEWALCAAQKRGGHQLDIFVPVGPCSEEFKCLTLDT
jgi:hypothetical protein